MGRGPKGFVEPKSTYFSNMSRPKIVIKSKSNKEDLTPSKETMPTAEPAVVEQSNVVADHIEETHEDLASQPSRISIPQWTWLAIGALVIAIVGALIYFFFFRVDEGSEFDNGITELATTIEEEGEEGTSSLYEQQYEDYEKDILSERIDFTDLLEKIGIAGADINQMRQDADKKNIRILGKGDKYAIYYVEEEPKLMVIEQKENPYVKFEVNLESLSINQLKKKREVKLMELAGIVESNLGITFINNSFNLKLINRLEEIFEYSVDLFSVDDGDRFKILYEQEFLDNKPYDILRIRAAYIQENGRDYYAFMNKAGSKIEYFNEFGESLKRSFLSSPIKYGGVISSGFGLRIHPKDGHEKMHLGTDYAAPIGTPIIATADGVVIIQNHKENNGNYVKIKHDNTFETQYLHMQKFPEGQRTGSRVKQGDIIGYVGMTGKTTGPHVCYRFWKNKEQVNPKDHGGNVTSRIPSKNLSKYMEYVKPLKNALRKIEYL